MQMENMVIQEVEDDACSPQVNRKGLYNKNFAVTFQFEDTSSFTNLDNVNEDTTDTNTGNSPAVDDEEEGFVMRGKSSTISKCQNIEFKPIGGSVNLKRRAFLPQSRMSITIPSAAKIECAASKQETSFTSKYQLGKKLGEGANGVVKVCYEIDEQTNQANTSKPYAVKIFKTQSIIETLEIQRESQILQQLNHPAIIKFKDLVIEKNKNKAYLVQEYARGKLLTSHLREDCKDGKMDEKVAIIIIKQILQGLSNLHSKNFCHFDIKTDNIIFNELENKVKIIDFSSSRKQCPKQKLLTNIGTLNYKSPEYFDGSLRNTKSDIWSTGVILYQLLTGSLPFDDLSNNPKRIIENIKIRSFQQDYKTMISTKMAELLDCMLVIDPTQRYSASQILSKLPQQIDLFSIEQLIKRQPKQSLKKKTNQCCSLLTIDSFNSRQNTKSQFKEQISPEMNFAKTDRQIKINTIEINTYKNIGSIEFDNIIV